MSLLILIIHTLLVEGKHGRCLLTETEDTGDIFLHSMALGYNYPQKYLRILRTITTTFLDPDRLILPSFSTSLRFAVWWMMPRISPYAQPAASLHHP
jgi:hypothetical protein